jgi:diguanylate cyclase (GGDEF)-like protein/PAS domain S-box-containing protein
MPADDVDTILRHPVVSTHAFAPSTLASLEQVKEAVYFVDCERRITFWNHAAELISGYPASFVLGRSCRDNILIHTDSLGCQLCLQGCPLQATIDDSCSRQANVYLHHADGHRVPVTVQTRAIFDPAGAIAGGIEIFREQEAAGEDVGEKQFAGQPVRLDPVTSTGTESFSESILAERAALPRTRASSLVVCLIDVDELDCVSRHGEVAVATIMLRVTARTLAKVVRPSDYLGRWRNHHFIVVMAKTSASQAMMMAARFCALVRSSPVSLLSREYRPTISVGLAVSHTSESVCELLARAEKNLAAAKERGGNRFWGP